MSHIDNLIANLSRATDNLERNRLAIQLTETRDSRAKSVLLELIRRPELQNSRGTLLNCLSGFDNSDIFEYRIDLIIGGNWEVAHEAFMLINKIEHIDGAEASRAYEKISTALKSLREDDWRAPIIRDLLDLFE